MKNRRREQETALSWALATTTGTASTATSATPSGVSRNPKPYVLRQCSSVLDGKTKTLKFFAGYVVLLSDVMHKMFLIMQALFSVYNLERAKDSNTRYLQGMALDLDTMTVLSNAAPFPQA